MIHQPKLSVEFVCGPYAVTLQWTPIVWNCLIQLIVILNFKILVESRKL